MFSDPRKNLEQFDIAPGMKVADFGSGAGHYTFLLGQMVGPSGQVFALDVQKELLVTLKREAEKAHLSNIEILCVDFDCGTGIGSEIRSGLASGLGAGLSSTLGVGSGSTKLKSNFIERGVVANVLFQISDKEHFAKEIARVLKPGGKLLVVDWMDSFGGIGPDKKMVFPKAACQALFEKSGFELEKNISAGLHHYGFVFKKV